MANDEDYPADFDLSTDEINGGSPISGEVLGPAPDSSNDEEYQDNSIDEVEPLGVLEVNWNGNDEYDSGDDDFDVDEYYGGDYGGMDNISIIDPASLHVANEQEISNVQDDEPFDKTMEDFLKVLLPSAMSARPDLLKDGFEPDQIEKCLNDVGYGIQSITRLYLGEEFEKIQSKAPVEYCHALVNAGWLQHDNRKFFPIVPESQRNHFEALIEGSDNLTRFTEKKKKDMETFKSEQDELRALHTFNMICRLLHAVRDELKQSRVGYSSLSNAFGHMVKGEKFKKIHDDYAKLLSLDPNKLWNPAWFNAYVNRSSLQKFIQMARFSEIKITNTQPTYLYFRADDEGGRPVKMFTQKDFKEVKEKWRTGNQGNRNFGKNYGREGQGGLPKQPQQNQPRRQIEEDPNYRPANLDSGSTTDDESQQPSTSNHRPRQRNPSPIRNRSPSPRRDERKSDTDLQVPRSETPESEKSSGSQRNFPVDPFSGRPAQQRDETNRENRGGEKSRGYHGGSRGAEQKRDVARVQDYGASTSEDDYTSDGSYSDESPEDKERKRVKRLQSKKKKEEKELSRRKRHEDERNRPSVPTRFNRYYATEQTTRPESPTPATSAENGPSAPAQSQPTASSAQQPLSDDEEILPPTGELKTTKAVAVVSNSSHNEQRSQSQLPYRPADGVLEKKKAERDRLMLHEQLSEIRKEETSNRQASVSSRNGNVDSLSENQGDFREPELSGGFGAIRSFPVQQNQSAPPQQSAFNQQGPPVDTYQGRNRQRNPPLSGPVNPIPYQQQQPNYQQQYPSQCQNPPVQQHPMQSPSMQPPPMQPPYQQGSSTRHPTRSPEYQMNNVPDYQRFSQQPNTQQMNHNSINAPSMNTSRMCSPELNGQQMNGNQNGYQQIDYNRGNGYHNNGQPMNYNGPTRNQNMEQNQSSYPGIYSNQPQNFAQQQQQPTRHQDYYTNASNPQQFNQQHQRTPSGGQGWNVYEARNAQFNPPSNLNQNYRSFDNEDSISVIRCNPRTENHDTMYTGIIMSVLYEHSCRSSYLPVHELRHAVEVKGIPPYVDPVMFIHRELRGKAEYNPETGFFRIF